MYNSDMTDLELICAVRQNDRSAFDFIYIKNWKMLYNVVYECTLSITMTESIVQQVFVELWISREPVSETDLSVYLLKIAEQIILSEEI
ncbi:hypothetical protein OQY15_16065 [Pedobacter sp. MC2016-15]|uniref:RNA polymerase sigma factor n=1 Tax=Pedobacter sp. MC2016-15 TaxID=2994473 RepID=UPI002247604E|nr:hypothetical protein [Pedobacter sp. MC2016-15]MCX2480621.1 hypothetical protein [Pedobacter sp. MC2016-15]